MSEPKGNLTLVYTYRGLGNPRLPGQHLQFITSMASQFVTGSTIAQGYIEGKSSSIDQQDRLLVNTVQDTRSPNSYVSGVQSFLSNSAWMGEYFNNSVFPCAHV